MSAVRAIFIGASAGGVTATQTLLQHLHDFSIPLVIVQHLPSDALIEPDLVFGAHSNLEVVEAEDKAPIQKKHVYFAPPGYHLLIEKDFSFSLSQDAPVQFARPSIDVLFESAAEAYGNSACGVLLTGANADGASGLQSIYAHGGYTMVQDPKSAEVSTMPLAALELIRPNFVGDVDALARHLKTLDRETTI